MRVIGREGARRTSLRLIADEVGITEPGILHYFGTKENLYTQTLQMRDDENAVSHYDPERDPISSFIAIIEDNMAVPNLAHLFAQVALDAADPEHPAHQFFIDRTAVIQGFLTPAVAQMQADGVITNALPPDQIVRLLHAMADGLQLHWIQDPEFDIAGALRAFWRGMHVQHPSSDGR